MKGRVLQPLDVIFEDNHLLVVDKAPGIATQGARSDEPSMVRLAADYLRNKYSKPGNIFVGVVSRLDSLASGVLVFARTSKAASRLSEQIRDRTTTKRYLALVEGQIDQATEPVVLEHCLRKNDSAHRVEVVERNTVGAQTATLHYVPLLTIADQTVVRVELITGRKHQIRVQMAQIHHPIVGDAKYGAQTVWHGVIGLHCFENSFIHPTLRTPMNFRSLPNHWRIRLGAKAIDHLAELIQTDTKKMSDN